MRSGYADSYTGASASLMPLGTEPDGTPRYLITHIGVRPDARGSGHGSEMLRRVIADSEADGAVLCASVQPDDSGGLSFGDLVTWYRKYGFVRHPESDDDEALVRYPQHRLTGAVPVSTALLLPDMTPREAVLAAEVRRLRSALDDADFVAMVREFHDRFGVAVRSTPVPDVPERAARQSMLADEWREEVEAYDAGDFPGTLKEQADVVSLIIGGWLAHGVPAHELFRAVHEANMSKVGADGRPVIRADGKVLKEGTLYRPPDVPALLRAAGWQD